MLLANRNNFFDEMFQDPFFTRPYHDASNQVMKTDVHEKDNNYLIEMELPGYAKEDINAELKDGYLTISATKDESKEEKDDKGNCIRRERYTGNCSRNFYVGQTIKKEDIKAAFSDGILKLVIPKETPEEIKTSSQILIE